jgi:hypothetical protein
VGLLGVLFGTRAAACKLCRDRARRAALRAVAQADSPTALLRAWLAVPPRARVPAAPTLQAWLQAAGLPQTHALRRHAERLQRMLYLDPPGVGRADFAALATAVYEALHRRR